MTAFWDLELDKQMDFMEGIRRNARVCVYMLVSVYIWQIVLIHTAVLVWRDVRGQCLLDERTPVAPRCTSLGEPWAVGCQMVSRVLTPDI